MYHKTFLWWLLRAIAKYLDVCVVLKRHNYTDEFGNLLISQQFCCVHEKDGDGAWCHYHQD